MNVSYLHLCMLQITLLNRSLYENAFLGSAEEYASFRMPSCCSRKMEGGLISLRKGTELMDEEEENIEKLPTFKHTIDVPELLKGSSSRKDN